ncbi:hypothetical protein SAMN05518672_102366 [Chitinophaga sp. CF118]|uniref:hypothetical protein n=1 Tax=Chitinophaga sp. CF118 TaxID=1884367 RepID=UPI0008F3F318|nr:hypothetical protein [Chitinophaga sp. CF118]SFD54363.1 hypothetical protein SAMN05518672_102366 [Chitinophaga sp. CF118]
MNKYQIILDEDKMNRLNKPLSMRYANGEKIDFNNEGIGYIVARRTDEIPILLKNILEDGEGYASEYSGFTMGPMTEGDIIWLDQGLVRVFVMDTHTIITYKEFYELSLQIAEKALEAMTIFELKEKGKVDDKWEEDIRKYIPLLKEQLALFQ